MTDAGIVQAFVDEIDELRAEVERLTEAYQKQVEHNRWAAEKHGEHIHLLSDNIERLRACTNEHAVSALGALQELTDSNNTDNPWLGVTAAVVLLKTDNEQLKTELARWKPSQCGKIFPWPRPGEVVIHCAREPDHDGAHQTSPVSDWVFAETSQT